MNKSLFSTALSAGALALSVFLIGCEPQLQFSTENITVQAKNAVDVLPADPVFVGMLNTGDLKENQHTDVFGPGGLMRHNMSQESLARLQNFIESTGFDPMEDLSEIYVAFEDIPGDNPPKASFVAYASIEPERLRSYVEEQIGDQLRLRTYRGVDLYENENDDHGPSFSILNDDMIIAASTTDALEDMIDRLQGDGDALSSNDAMMDLVTRASAGRSGWFVARKPEDASMNMHDSGNDLEQTAVQIWSALDRVVVAVNVESSGVDSQVFLYPNARVSADDLSSLTKGMIATMKVNPEIDQNGLEMLDEIRVDVVNDHVRIGTFVDNSMMQRVKG